MKKHIKEHLEQKKMCQKIEINRELTMDKMR